MGYVRTAQPLPIPLPGLKVDLYGISTAIPIGLSQDRRTVYGAALGIATQVVQSTNDGTTWTNVFNFPIPISGLVETDDGEALAFAFASGSPALGTIYKSTGWATSHTTATWRVVLSAPGGYFRIQWSAGPNAMGNDLIRANTSRVMVVSEYGSTTTSTGDQTQKATRVWISVDYGATWTIILNLSSRYPGVGNLHVHGCAYDPWWDRVWVLYGDSNAESASSQKILYSDDRGATWAAVPQGVSFNNGQVQSTAIAVLESCIIIGGDNITGWYRIARKGYRKQGDLQVVANLVGGGGAMFIASKLHQNRRQPSAPLFGAVQSQAAECRSSIVVSRDGGASLTTLWDDANMAGASKGVLNIFGPTFNGKIVAHVSPNGTDAGTGTQWLLRGELVIPDVGLVDGRATIAGDGATTVFNIAHGLSATPNRYVVWEEAPVGAYTVSVTSTNIVLTFTTAPATGSYPFQWRAGA